jgi:hypothetical protein
LFNGKEWKIMSALFSYNDQRITPEPDQLDTGIEK